MSAGSRPCRDPGGQRVIGDDGRDVERAVPLEERDAAGVHQVAVLDAPHARLQAAVDGAGGVGVAGHVDVGGGGFLDDRPQFVHGELGGVHPVAGRVDRAAQVHLDVMRAAADLLADRPPDLVHAVADDPDGGGVVVAVVHGAARRAPVAGPAGLGQLLAAVEQPRPGEVALLDGPGQPGLAGPDVPDGGEAASQHARQDVAGPGGDIAGRPLGHAEDVVIHDGRVGVGVDKPGHDRAAGDVDDDRVARTRQAGPDVGDPAVLHGHRLAVPENPVRGIEHRRVPQDRYCHGCLPP